MIGAGADAAEPDTVPAQNRVKVLLPDGPVAAPPVPDAPEPVAGEAGPGLAEPATEWADSITGPVSTSCSVRM